MKNDTQFIIIRQNESSHTQWFKHCGFLDFCFFHSKHHLTKLSKNVSLKARWQSLRYVTMQSAQPWAKRRVLIKHFKVTSVNIPWIKLHPHSLSRLPLDCQHTGHLTSLNLGQSLANLDDMHQRLKVNRSVTSGNQRKRDPWVLTVTWMNCNPSKAEYNHINQDYLLQLIRYLIRGFNVSLNFPCMS